MPQWLITVGQAIEQVLPTVHSNGSARLCQSCAALAKTEGCPSETACLLCRRRASLRSSEREPLRLPKSYPLPLSSQFPGWVLASRPLLEAACQREPRRRSASYWSMVQPAPAGNAPAQPRRRSASSATGPSRTRTCVAVSHVHYRSDYFWSTRCLEPFVRACRRADTLCVVQERVSATSRVYTVLGTTGNVYKARTPWCWLYVCTFDTMHPIRSCRHVPRALLDDRVLAAHRKHCHACYLIHAHYKQRA
jgi:hypothetical protein